MKLLVLMEIDVPKAISETIQRTGFELVPDGTCMQVKVPNSPSVPQRKTKLAFVSNPKHSLKDILKVLSEDSASALEPSPVANSSQEGK